jgi:hypothetical protein
MASASAANINRYDLEANGMNEYERRTTEWNQSDQVQEMRGRRHAAINNTPGYHTGDRIHHLRATQICDPALWNALFGREILNPVLREYAQASMNWANDETNTLLFAGQMEVSLLMQENYRPGVHLAVFFIYLGPHRHFYDGHVIQMEFGEGSHTHQTVVRLFDVTDRAIVLQATEYQILGYIADDDEALDLLHSCFLQPDFAPMRFVFVEPNNGDDDDDDDGYYLVNENAGNNHRWHTFADDDDAADAADAADADDAAIPPPQPINNFVDIYLAHLHQYDAQHIPYDSDDEDEDEVRG